MMRALTEMYVWDATSIRFYDLVNPSNACRERDGLIGISTAPKVEGTTFYNLWLIYV
jgi:hypothetical protein